MTTRLRVLVADDEPPARRTLRLLLADHPSVGSVAEAASGEAVIEALESDDFDLLFLDIDLGDLSGFEVLEQMDRRRLPLIVFVTAYEEFALEAFEIEAIDYLLKPFTDERFFQALDRARGRIEAGDLADLRQRIEQLLDRASVERRWLRRILVRKAGRVLFLSVDEIDWFEAEDYYCRVHSRAGSYLVRRSLNALESELDPVSFSRTHRSAIVNLERVRQVEELGRGDGVVLLDDGSRVRLSRSRRRAFEEAMTRLR